jgi:NAD(P)-dependent dehydrogenase (short-subunit alcohol dehydrogenase family)
VNHFPFNLFVLFLIITLSGRIVTVSSSTHHLVKGMNLDDVMSEKSYELFQTYAQSKLANILFTKELQKRFGVFI